MKLLKTSRRDGYSRIMVENEDDLWHLESIIAPGDRLRKTTQRTQLDGREKKTLKLSLKAEKIELQNDRLRVTGEIQEADDQVELGYHTFNIKPNDEFELWRDDTTDQFWKDLEEAEDTRSYTVLFCLVEKGEADLYLVRESGIESISGLSENVPGKLYEDDTGGDFHQTVAQALERSAKDVDNVILAGPGFEKRHVENELSDETMSKVFVQDTSVTGRTGLNEAIKRGALDKVVKSSRVSEESKSVEEFFEQLNSDMADYGEPVKQMAEQGAVEKLLVTMEKFREEQKMVKNVKQNGGEIVKIHTDHEAGKRLEKLGGIGAVLRYRPG